jgi:RHS repeat-associated protein
VHVADDTRRIALVETRVDTPVPERTTRYQLGNHLGSVALELDHQSALISYEEYTPYGSTTYQAMSGQLEAGARYRYAAKERDDESGLYYYGARYYAAWLGRWVSGDPAQASNRYPYADGNPVTLADPDGRDPACAGQEECSLGLLDIYRIHKQVIDKYGASEWMTSQEAAREAKQLSDEQKQANYEAAQAEAAEKAAEGPTWWDRFTDTVKEKAGAAAEWVSETRAGQEVAKVDESLRETARNVGSEAFDNTLGGIQRSQQIKQGTTQQDYYAKPSEMGGDLAEGGYELIRDKAVFKGTLSMVGTVVKIPKGGAFKKYWNKQEEAAAEFVWRTEGKLWRREATIWLMKDGKMVKTKRRLDALLFDHTTGEIQAAEWSTARELSEGARKKAQLEYQKELFDKAKDGWTILARPEGEEAYFDITKAVQRTEVYPHWRKPQ